MILIRLRTASHTGLRGIWVAQSSLIDSKPELTIDFCVSSTKVTLVDPV